MDEKLFRSCVVSVMSVLSPTPEKRRGKIKEEKKKELCREGKEKIKPGLSRSRRENSEIRSAELKSHLRLPATVRRYTWISLLLCVSGGASCAPGAHYELRTTPTALACPETDRQTEGDRGRQTDRGMVLLRERIKKKRRRSRLTGKNCKP